MRSSTDVSGGVLPGPATFWWEPGEERWHWSAGLFELLGYSADGDEQPRPGFDLLLRHEHDLDRGRTEQALKRVARDRQPFVFEHRIVPRDGGGRTVILAVSLLAPEPCVVSGAFIDVTDARRIYYAAEGDTIGALQSQIARLSEQSATREVVSRAAGVLIERNKITHDQAEELLRKASQDSCRKLTDVAAELLYPGRLPISATQVHRPKPGPRGTRPTGG